MKSTTTNTLRISGLTPNKEYQYTVKAKDPQGHTGTRSEAVLVAPKIKTVKGFTATDVYSHSATLTWKKQSEVSGYKIYKYNPSTKKYEYIKKLVGNDKISYPVKGLTSAKVYKYRICSYYNSINGPKTTLEFSTKPLKMTITKLTSSNKSLTVKWKKVRGKRYVIYYSTNSKFTNRKAIVLSTKYSSYTIDNLKKSTKYYVKMRAYTVYDDKKIYGKYSDVKTKNL